MKPLLIETTMQRLRIIESDETGLTKISGVAGSVDTVNGNGRVYPKSVIERQLPTFIEEAMTSNRVGAVDHPEASPRISDLALRFTDLRVDSNNVTFEALIIPTLRGKDLEALIRAGVSVGISSRGYGSVKKGEWQGKPANIIQDDYELVTYDAVVEPSVANARIVAHEHMERNLEQIDRLLNMDPEKLQAIVDSVATPGDVVEDVSPEVVTQVVGEVSSTPIAEGSTPTETTDEAQTTPEASAESAQTPEETPATLTEAETRVKALEESLAAERARVIDLAEAKAQVEAKSARLKESAESLGVLLVALKTAIAAEMADDDWNDIGMLGSFGQSVAWRASYEDWCADTEMGDAQVHPTIAAIEALKDLVPAFLKQAKTARTKEAIFTKTRDEKFGRAIAAVLVEAATSTKDVEALFEDIKTRVVQKLNDVTPVSTKGNVTPETPRWNEEQLKQRALMGLPLA